ncbi:MAG: ATP synthase subunit delta [Candidatus Hydrogenedentes bacterium ADurb.Bin101]|nr:MAG: ATP synthase subunit delta [Candidatus Hydrogenedentes bacterium ADurb.Bin101]
MKIHQVAKKYTLALHAAITDREELQRTDRAYRTFMQICTAEPKLLRFLCNPIVPLSARQAVLDTALQACTPPPAMEALAHLLLKRNRFSLLPVIVSQYMEQVDTWLNRVEVTVYTTIPLTEELKAKMEQSLKNFTGSTIRMECIIDPAILGGLIVNMQGFSFDFSYRNRLKRLKEKLLTEEMLVYGD